MCQSRQKKSLSIIILMVLLVFTAFPVLAEPVKMIDLINNAATWDGKALTVEGEVIGDIMKRGDHAWINVSDGSSVMGIWITEEEAAKVKITGDYKHIGDQVKIEGIFHESFTEQGGDLAIEGKSLVVMQEGMKVFKSPSYGKVMVAIGLTLLVVVLNWVRVWAWTKQQFGKIQRKK